MSLSAVFKYTSRHAAVRRDGVYPPARPSAPVSHAPGLAADSQSDYYIQTAKQAVDCRNIMVVTVKGCVND